MTPSNNLGKGWIASEVFERRVSGVTFRPRSTKAEEKTQGELVEHLIDDGKHTGLLVLAPHGGELEPPTDLQSLRVLEKLRGHPVSTWRCEGFHPEGGKAAFDRWHITSTEIHEASFPLLAQVAQRRFAHVVSFHGMIDDRILVGGAAPTCLKTEILEAIRRALRGAKVAVDLALPGDPKSGGNPKNIVNRYTRAGGVQIEQSPRSRQDHWKTIADAVAKVYASKL